MLYGWYTALVYIACIPGGIIGDRYITSKNSVLYGGFLLCAGHFTLAFQNELFFFTGLILNHTWCWAFKTKYFNPGWTSL